MQGFVKEEVFCFRYPYFYFQHGESTSTASQQTSTASQLSKDLNKVPLLLPLVKACFRLLQNIEKYLKYQKIS